MTRRQTSLVLWSVILAAIASVYFFWFLPKQREREAQRQSAEILAPALRANPNFSKVEVHHTAQGPFFFLSGNVRTDADLAALNRLVKQTATPRTPLIDVRVSANP